MASLKLSGFVQNPVTGAGVPGARVYVFGRNNLGNKVATYSTYDDTDVTGRYEVTVDTAVVQTQSDKGYWVEFTNVVAPNQTRIIRTDVEFQVKYIHGLQDGFDLIPAPLMDGSIKTEMLANADALKGRGISLAKMLPNSVGTAQLLDANVTLAKMAPDSVNALNIVDGSVGTPELANLAVTQAKLATDSVSGGVNAGALGKIVANTIFDYNINTAANILGSKLADNSVPLAKLNFDVATQVELNTHTVRTDNPHSVTLAQVGGATAGHNHDAAYVNTSGAEIMAGPLQVGAADGTARVTAEIMATRANTPSHGLVYFGTSGTRWLLWDGSNYSFNGVANLYVNGGVVWHSNNLTPSSYLPSGGKAADSELLDGRDWSFFSPTTHDHGSTYLPYLGTAYDSTRLGGQGIGYFSPAGHGHSYADPAHTHAYLPSGGKAVDSDKLDGIDSLSFLRYRSGSYSGDGSAGRQISYGASDVANLVMLHIFEANGSTWILSGATGYGVGLAAGAGPGSDEVFNAANYIRTGTSTSYFEVGYTNAGLGANFGGSTFRWVVAYTT